MTKADTMKQARGKRDGERLLLEERHLSLDDYRAERKRINNEYVAVLEANKPTHNRLPAWLKADNAAFERWQAAQVK